MEKNIEMILSALTDHREVKKSYRSYLRYIHNILEEYLLIKNSVFIFRIQNYFIKSEYINRNWFLRIDNIDNDKSYASLKNISIKEIINLNPRLRLLSKTFQKENDLNILYDSIEDTQSLKKLSNFIFFMLDSLFSQFIQTQKAKKVICLFKLKALALAPNVTVESYLHSIVGVIASTWTFNQYAQARIVYQNHEVTTKRFSSSILSMQTDLYKDQNPVGFLEIVYPESILNQAEYPFLQVEKQLIIDIATELSIILSEYLNGRDNSQFLKQLRHTDRLATLGQLVSGISNQLNEPLNDILGFSELLSINDSLDAEAKVDLKKIINASLSVRDTVKKLMHFSGEVASKLEKVDINDSIKTALSLLRARSNRKDIEIKLHLHSSIPYILIDSSQFHQILVNILLNSEQAIKHDKGVIEITTETHENSVIMTISDNGEGIPAELKSKIFIPLFSTKHENIGTGIGLSVAKNLIEANGGVISFQSSVKVGTIFTLVFPIHKEVADE